MSPSSAHLRRRFLSWDRPLLPQLVDWLAADWNGEGPLDLSELLVVVPTRQAGRRLREALAAHAALRGGAVFPPRVVLPESLLDSASVDVAPRLDALLAWAAVFLETPLDEVRAVFPVDPPARNVAWGLRLARQFTALQRSLIEAGLSLSEVEMKVGAGFPELERWRQIGLLERLQAQRLARRGLQDPSASILKFIREAGASASPPLFAGVRRIAVLATPDPQPLALSVLERQSVLRPIDIVVFAPASESAAFDEWGRPLASAWTDRLLPLPRFEERVHLCADAADQAERIAEVARSYDSPEGVLAVGSTDAGILPLLENELSRVNRVSFNPDGRRRKGDALHQLLSALASLVREESFGAIETLARCPDFLLFLDGRIDGFSAALFLQELDRLHSRHLPPTLAEARRAAAVGEHSSLPGRALLVAALACIAEIRAILQAGTFPENGAKALGMIFEHRRFDLVESADATLAEAAGAWTSVMQECESARASFGGNLTSADWWEVALQLYGESARYEEKPPGAIELQGWLELLWEDAPHLVVAGLNDGWVPEAIAGDAFLPESLRQQLGLKTNAARFARDAYVLQALAASRGGAVNSGENPARGDSHAAPAGRLDLLVGRNSATGDPLRPSRLLLRCEEADLPDRVRFLFRPAESAGSALPWQRAWKLTPPPAAVPTRVAVTALRAWLACPFRFYLNRIQKMEPVDAGKNELDALDFGILCHAALEAMGNAAALRECADPVILREFLLAALEQETARRYGTQLSLPLVVQVESARQRLSRAAEVQAQSRADGWVIVRVEEKFELEIGGLVISGKIDRIDRHERTGAFRVLDYKTSDQPVDPWEAHLRGLRRGENPPEFARFGLNGRDYVWSDLQLPVYLRALGAEAAAGVTGAYFNLPKAATATGIRPWDDYTRELEVSAWRCAHGIAAAIQAGEFWPPNETIDPDRDVFASLFHHGVAESVAWTSAVRPASPPRGELPA